MGREIKRVALDFNHPLNEVWEGFINPHYVATLCKMCEGSGNSLEANHLKNQWYGYADFDPSMTGSKPLTIDNPVVQNFAMRNVRNFRYSYSKFRVDTEAQRLIDKWNKQWEYHLDQDDVDALLEHHRLHDFTENDIEHPTAEQVNEWAITAGIFGHDAINSWICIEAKCTRMGVAHKCSVCNGEGEIWPSEEAKKLYDEWQPTEPPSGEGWQLWETVTEGSPISPVFATKEEFIAYLIGAGHTKSVAEKFCEAGYAPSMSIIDGELRSDIDTFDALD